MIMHVAVIDYPYPSGYGTEHRRRLRTLRLFIRVGESSGFMNTAVKVRSWERGRPPAESGTWLVLD
ncbi:MAG: hypothetical protein ACR2L2_09595, partial [Acidobacteriota bacterium]